MKKFISLILTLALIMTAISGISASAANSVLLNENFYDGISKIVTDDVINTA